MKLYFQELQESVRKLAIAYTSSIQYSEVMMKRRYKYTTWKAKSPAIKGKWDNYNYIVLIKNYPQQ